MSRKPVLPLLLVSVGWLCSLMLAVGIALLVRPLSGPDKLPDAAVGAMGWVDDQTLVGQVVEDLPIKSFADTPAFIAGAEPESVYLWDAARKATGDVIPCRNQGSVGSCVAFGAACAAEHLMCVQIALLQRPEEFKDLAQEVIYGGSRVEIGGGRIRGDGSVGAWAAKWVREYGLVARGVYGSIDLSRYSEATCRAFGRSGVPDDLEQLARGRPVRSITQVRTATECRRALASGYPVTIASSQGFRMQRDSQGFCSPAGTWMHQMCVIGYRKGSRPGFWIQNSWGAQAHTGPKGEGSPPDGGFWADEGVVHRMLGQGDSWAFADLDGFPARNIDWFSRVAPRRHKLDTETLLGVAW